MHKRNIALTALVLAALVTGAFFVFPNLHRPDAVGIFYFPAILLAVILSGGSHSPPVAAGMAAFIAYTLSYWAAFLIIYALLWEIYLLRQVAHHLEGAEADLRHGEAHSQLYLRRLGIAIADLENRRRKHFLLSPIKELDLSMAPHLLAANAIVKAGDHRAVRTLLRRYEGVITGIKGRDAAKSMMRKLTDDAQTMVNPN